VKSRVILVALAVPLLGVVACTDDGGMPTTSDVSGPGTTEPVRVSHTYRFEPGRPLVYRLEMSRHLTYTTTGAPDAVADQELPESADVRIEASGLVTYVFEEGESPGTYLVTIEGEYDAIRVEGTVDDEAVDDPDAIEALVTLDPVSAVMVVDERGRMVEPPAQQETLDGPSLPGSGSEMAGFMGPILPADPIGTGESWSETFTEMAMGAAPVETSLEGRLIGPETVGGKETLRFENESATEAGEIDLADFYREFFAGFAEGGEVDLAVLEELVFRIMIEPSVSEVTGWLDPERGTVIRSTRTGASRTSMEVALPDEVTGELERFDMSLGIDQTLDYRLEEGESP
jgi:hypothetical protein